MMMNVASSFPSFKYDFDISRTVFDGYIDDGDKSMLVTLSLCKLEHVDAENKRNRHQTLGVVDNPFRPQHLSPIDVANCHHSFDPSKLWIAVIQSFRWHARLTVIPRLFKFDFSVSVISNDLFGRVGERFATYLLNFHFLRFNHCFSLNNNDRIKRFHATEVPFSYYQIYF